ncbi:MAG: SAM-dependent methyltransferase [Clostridiales bacterium]|jgi:23S rRNA (cytosine1962-C5)-methyltransferase|nr:SAM-dependent methyltransferase [Clostridiales bacterium]HOB64491.1 class I SAM-dependent methyltransferase [Clostridia bacterium]HOK81315.1 class I SAM-dependent methyltransferase [Clostridia bacterium]HOL60434.1 class I SAM-dependent methyltransferase [Clostridia bacterium]HPO53191.1 class I SAM-dependent methyltransferase [Clostridia bacterium]
MNTDTNASWRDYRVIATGDGYKLEDFGGIILLRPDPQIIWRAPFDMRKYEGLHAVYERSSSGGGAWKILRRVPDEFFVNWRSLKFSLKLMGFKHTGVFPEQASNWARIISMIQGAGRPISVLNLFAYTGGATLAAASAGASVCHVDAAKAMCERAGVNARLSGLSDAPIRYIVDDCVKFVEREIKRGRRYDAIIMDPPSYGRGPKGETWKLEDKIYDLVCLTRQVLSDKPLFYLINSYTTGLQPTVMKNIASLGLDGLTGETEAFELGLPTGDPRIILPCGTTCITSFK